jgi:hypothetical protein
MKTPLRKLEMTQGDIKALGALPPIRIEMDAGRAFQILAVIQLASRHPQARVSTTLKMSMDFAKDLQRYLSVTPNLALLCEAGWDPGQDVPA